MAKRGDSPTADLKVRMKEPLRAKIEAAAAAKGVSMNAEAVDRLDRSFDDDTLFGSSVVRNWAIRLAHTFHDAGSRDEQMDQSSSWMRDPDALAKATYVAMQSLITDLARNPGVSFETAEMYVNELRAHLINAWVSAGRARFVDKDGKPMLPDIDWKGDDNAR
ncbi:hypothetical protein [Mesorhizobium delmotii]|uniref:Arc-like DNA binding domain-containing protein n=1 Tax=Mesorhizobium delmotii TaxID=1631247 RepID=A0A2P9APS6_9HYPH|nr:hypothetical protein [Mesorhizobium delmotii]SJM33126.1 hypothetical protein BQ8482_340022 [Mesorhizobium delmotii]